MTRYPLEALLSLTTGGLRIGAGPAIHLGAAVTCEGSLCGGVSKIELDTALGVVLQMAIGFGRGIQGGEVGIRYTKIDYSVNGGPSVDGGSVGFFLGGTL